MSADSCAFPNHQLSENSDVTEVSQHHEADGLVANQRQTKKSSKKSTKKGSKSSVVASETVKRDASKKGSQKKPYVVPEPKPSEPIVVVLDSSNDAESCGSCSASHLKTSRSLKPTDAKLSQLAEELVNEIVKCGKTKVSFVFEQGTIEFTPKDEVRSNNTDSSSVDLKTQDLHNAQRIICGALGLHMVEKEPSFGDFAHFIAINKTIFIANQGSGQHPDDCQLSTKEVCADKLLDVELTETTMVYDDCTLRKFTVTEPYVKHDVFKFEGIDFTKGLQALQANLRYGDDFGVPMPIFLNTEERYAIVSDFGCRLEECYSTKFEPKEVAMSIACLCFVNNKVKLEASDLHVLLKDTVFQYKWTVKDGNSYFIMEWTNHGIIVFPDFKKAVSQEKDEKKFFVPKTTLPFDSDLDLAGEYENFATFREKLEKGQICQIETHEIPSKALTHNGRKGGVVEVFPFVEKIKEQARRSFSNNIGRIKEFKNGWDDPHVEKMETLVKPILFNIRSDTGLVLLCNKCLIAAVDIDPGKLITVIPCTDRYNVYTGISPFRFLLPDEGSPEKKQNRKEVVALQRAIPYCGFGGFAKFTRQKIIIWLLCPLK